MRVSSFHVLAVAFSVWFSGARVACAQLKLPGFDLSAPDAATAEPSEVAGASGTLIPAVAVADRAREADTLLRDAEQARGDWELHRVGDELPGLLQDISELAKISSEKIAGSQRRGQHDLRLRWDGLHDQLAGWQRLLERRTSVIETQQRALAALRQTWSATAKALRADRAAPRGALVRVEQVLRDIDAAQHALNTSAAGLFELEDRLGSAQDSLDANLERVRAAHERLNESVFRRTGVSVWEIALAASRGALAPPRAHGEYIVSGLRAFWGQYAGRVPFDAGVLATLLGCAVLLARRARRRALEAGHEVAGILNAPLLGATLIALVATVFLYPGSMFVVLDLLALASLLPLSALAPLLVRHHDLLLPVRALIGVLALHRALLLAHLEEPWHELATLLLGALLWLAIYWMRRTRRALPLEEEPTRLERAITLFTQASLSGLGVAVAAGLLGYDTLLEFLIDGFTGSAYWLLVSLTINRVLDAFADAAFEMELVRGLGSMRHYGALIRGRALNAARWAGIVLWTAATLYAFGLMDPALALLRYVFGTRAQIGSWSISLGDLTRFALTMYLSVQAARLVSFLLDEDVLPKLNLARGVPATISRLSRYLVLAFGFLVAVGAAGVNMGQIALLASALSVGIGFGLQNVVNNFVSGLMLIFERPIRIGDTVQLGELVGEVRTIGIRASTLRTAQGAEVILPNAELISNKVINWTLSDFRRRIEIPVGVAYGSEPTKVMELMKAAVASIEDVERTPEPVCIFTSFGESALNFELRIWVRRSDDWPNVRSAALVAIYQRLSEAGVEIPFPQRDLHVRTLDVARPAAALAGALDGTLKS